MKERLHQKLNSQRGVSMIFALIFFLLCATIGAIVLTASTVSVGKTVGDRRTQRGYLAVSSAARLVEQDFSKLSFTGAYKSVEVTTTTVTPPVGDDEGSTSVDQQPPLYSFCTDLSGFHDSRIMASSLIDLSGIYYNNLPGSSRVFPSPGGVYAQQSFTLSFPENEGLSIPAVAGTVTIDTQYRMTVELHEVDGDNILYLLYTPTISAPAVSADSSSSESGDGNEATETVTTVYTTTVTWGEPIYSREGGEP